MKRKLKISTRCSSPEESVIYTIAYNKVAEDGREHKRTRSDSIGNESADLETALSKTGYGKFNYLILLLTIPAASSSPWVTAAVSFILPMAGCDMNLTSIDKAWLNSAPYAGMILSAFFWGFLSDTYGRQRLLTYGFLVDSLLGISASFSPTLWPMVFFKFMSGIMICGPYSIFMAYISEVFMDKDRDFAVSAVGVFSALGNLMQPALAWLLIPYHISWTFWDGYDYTSWRLFLFICSLLSFICGIASAFSVESPKFLLEKGRQEEALNVFKTIYAINTGKPDYTYPVRKLKDISYPSAKINFECQKSFCERLYNGLKQALKLLKPPFLFRVLFVVFIQTGSISSLNILRLWLPQIFSIIDTPSAISNSTISENQGLCARLTESAKNTKAVTCENLVIKPELYMNMILINCGELFAQCLYMFLVKCLQKKTIISATTAFSAVLMVALPIVGKDILVFLTTCILSMLNMTFFCVIGCVVEIFPTAIRATSVCFTIMCGRIGILLANFGVSSVMYTHCNIIFYISFCVLAAIAISSLFLSSKPIDVKFGGTNIVA